MKKIRKLEPFVPEKPVVFFPDNSKPKIQYAVVIDDFWWVVEDE